MNQPIQIAGVDVWLEGEGPHTVVMLHGWPDSPALWDSAVDSLKDNYRCVRFHLPGYQLCKPSRPLSVRDTTELISAIVDAVSPMEPVTLLLHDWGCLFGYEFAARHAHRVARVVGVDIGDTGSDAYLKSLGARQKLMIAGYQLWLATAWRLGPWVPGLANRMTRFMARSVGCRNDAERVVWQMNYPYAMQWLGALGGLRGLLPVESLLGASMPALYLYGQRKPFMFHSPGWVEQLARTPGCAVHALETGHWVMRHKPEEFNSIVRSWLDQGNSKAGANP
jgi:pimeloyl-ACP methyl ester carboxylesterase